ncbi:MAG TPA: asparagine synthase (glutamine-hydrolyzing) [Thermoanaerobaculia bacterium]|nr:asparagine synthase (glutamine-hydrolyzing) [Thermoanaerobaculia bacterium]
MCGIAGILCFDGAPVAIDELRRMTDAIVHRGPDDEGFHCAPGIGLGMRRLSIIDLATGQQPIANEDGSVWVVCNGEIYNFRELRAELEAKGHVFSCGSDVEVIVHLYEEHGARCLERLRGMFALALWDDRRQRLLLARDRLGIKPLFFAEKDGRLLFGSEVKAILPALGESPRLDWGALDHLLRYSTTAPAQSIVDGVRKLEPGHLLTASAAHGVAMRRWWEVRFEPVYGRTEEQWIDRLGQALDESVRLHLVSDVPLGAFLSGGIDSSAVVAAMARAGEGEVRTFSIGFREREFDELPYARMVAAAFATHHREAVLEPDVLGMLDDLAWYLDEPFGDASAIPTYMVSKLAAEEVTVVLSGDGGDELFAGYDRYLVERRERLSRFVPAPLRSLGGAIGAAMPEGARGRELLRHFALEGWERYDDAGTLFKLDQRRKLYRGEILELASNAGQGFGAPASAPDGDGHWLSAVQRRDLEGYLPLDILTKVDRMSMAHSIETRVPLLDHVLVELAASLPPELRLRGTRTKYIFKRALEGVLPDAILERPKRGFAIPLGRWFRGRLATMVRELLLSEESRARDYFQAPYIETLLRLHQAGRPLDLQLWTLISFELWCRAFLVPGVRNARPARERGKGGEHARSARSAGSARKAVVGS